jgi:hypothetical protein
MSNPEPRQPPDTANGRPYGLRGRIRYTRPIDRAAPGDDTRFYCDDTLFYEEDTLMSGPGFEPGGPEFGPEFGPLPEAVGDAAGAPEPAQPADPAGGWPYEPEPVRFADSGDEPVTGADIRSYGEWGHESAVPAEPAAYKLPRNLEPSAGWVGGGFHAPGDEARPPWGDPYLAEPSAPESPRRGRRPAVRPLTVAALALTVVAAGAGGAVLGGKAASAPAAAPSAAASAGLSTAAGGTGSTASPQQPAAESPAISMADAENVVASYSQVNNKANAAHSDSLLSTIEGGSSYTMDTGAYRYELGQPSRAAYVPFQLTDTTYYIPRLPQGSYPALVRRQEHLRHRGGRQEPRHRLRRVRPERRRRTLERRHRAGHPARPRATADRSRLQRVRAERGPRGQRPGRRARQDRPGNSRMAEPARSQQVRQRDQGRVR